MTVCLIQVNLAHDSGLPEDVTVNTWHIDTTDTDPEVGATEFLADLEAFYLAIDSFLGVTLTGAAEVNCYNLDDPSPRVPFLTDTWSLTVDTSTLPQEVACCLSFQALPISGIPQARRRNRVYLGPISANAAANSTGRPSATFLGVLDTAATALLAASTADTEYAWVTWSATASMAAAVNNGWIDDAFDTVRSRGIAPTSRTVF